MNTRVTCAGARLWRPLIAGLVAMAFACLLSACSSSVLPGEPPQTPEQLVALVKRLADSGRLNDPESVASMLGTALTLNSHRTYRFRGCEIENVSYQIPRNYLHWDWLAQHPIISAGRPIEPEPFRPRITAYNVEFRKACGDKPAKTEANLTFSNINHWDRIDYAKSRRITRQTI